MDLTLQLANLMIFTFTKSLKGFVSGFRINIMSFVGLNILYFY